MLRQIGFTVRKMRHGPIFELGAKNSLKLGPNWFIAKKYSTFTGGTCNMAMESHRHVLSILKNFKNEGSVAKKVVSEMSYLSGTGTLTYHPDIDQPCSIDELQMHLYNLE